MFEILACSRKRSDLGPPQFVDDYENQVIPFMFSPAADHASPPSVGP